MTPYDRWRFTTPWDDEPDPPGAEPGEECGRYPEPDEDAPRGWKAKPCRGEMKLDPADPDFVICDTCGEVA